MLNTEKKLNIIISCGSYSWGGLEMISLETAKHLAGQKWCTVKILCSKGSRLETESQKSSFETLPYFSKNVNIISSVLKLKKYLSKNKTDIIHSNHSHDLWVLTPALNLSGGSTKLFLTKHMGSGIKKNDIMHKYLYRRVDNLFAISQYIKQSAENTCPLPAERIHLLHVGIDMNRFDLDKINKADIKKEFNIPRDKLIIGIAGRMTPGKGYEEFIEAARLINEKYSEKVHFMAVGSASFGEDQYEQDIKLLSKKLNIENLTFTGFTAEPQKLIGVFDILVFPSHNESFGRILLEAMALKIPVAASGNAGVLDIINDNETGLLFEPKNHLSIAEKLILLIEDDGLRKKLAESGYNRAKDNFSFEKMIIKLKEYYTN